MITGVYIGTERLELFEDEEIKIKSNVSDIEDITKIFTDTSNDFTVPASDVNNPIFKHWYESDIINGFDARRKVPATIEMHGMNYKVGKIRLKKVSFKHNQPENYSLEFFGNLVELKDTLLDDKLVSLDLNYLDFVYNSDNVKSRLQAIGDVSFSLLSKRRLLFDSTGTIDDNEKQTNIYYNGDDVNTGLRPRDLKASIKQLKIIEAIESKYSIEFSRDFLGGYDFSNQFLCLSGEEDLKTVVQLGLTNVDEGTDPTVNGNVMMFEGQGTDTERITQGIQLGIEVAAGYQDTVYSFYIKNGEKVVGKKENVKGNFLTSNVLNVFENEVDGDFNNVTFWLESSEKIVFQAEMYRNRFTRSRFKYNTGTLTPEIKFSISKRLPDLKIIDYLKGIFKMFKLVAIPKKDGSLYLDNLSNFHRNGKVYDLTKYIDYASHEVSAGTILNEIRYNFQEPQTVLNQQYVKNNGVGYGDLEHYIYEDPNAEDKKLINGDSLDFELPFEQIIYEKIKDLSKENTDTRIQYGLLQDENTDFVTIKPHVHYIERRATVYADLEPTVIKYVKDTNVSEFLESWNIPIHILDSENQTFSTTFGNEFNTFDSVLISNTIFSNYHKEYIDNVFTVNKREYNFKAIEVPLDIVLNIELNDIIEINKKYYRIDSLETSTSNNNIEFKLINDRNVNLT